MTMKSKIVPFRPRGLSLGLIALFAAFGVRGSANVSPVPPVGGMSAIPQEVSEIKTEPTRRDDLRTDQEMKHLSQVQRQYREVVPGSRRAQPLRKEAQRSRGKKIRR